MIVGNLDSPRYADVDTAGLVTPWPGGWTLDWWIGADDRWHVPSKEVAVRQRLLDGTPVVETAMRVPSGDVVHRAYAVRAGDVEVAVVEIANESPVPVALALSIGGVRRIELVDPTTVAVDRSVGLALPKPAARLVGSSAGSVADVVFAGDAGTELGVVKSRAGRAHAAFVWPLAHRTLLRFALPLVPQRAGSINVAQLPSAEQVVRGWKVHGERGVRLVVPDQDEVDSARLSLLLRHDKEPASVGTVQALVRYGYADEAAALLRQASAEVLIAGLAEHWRLVGDVELVRELAPAIEHAADRCPPALLDDVAVLLRAAGEEQAAIVAERLATPGGEAVAGDLLVRVRDQLVRETDDGLALASVVPDTWLGQGWEVHDAPTRFGRVSYAVRWHGDRPALLWELDPSAPARITAPGLDPTWSTTDARGDALLAPVLPPATPVTVRRR